MAKSFKTRLIPSPGYTMMLFFTMIAMLVGIACLAIENDEYDWASEPKGLAPPQKITPLPAPNQPSSPNNNAQMTFPLPDAFGKPDAVTELPPPATPPAEPVPSTPAVTSLPPLTNPTTPVVPVEPPATTTPPANTSTTPTTESEGMRPGFKLPRRR